MKAFSGRLFFLAAVFALLSSASLWAAVTNRALAQVPAKGQTGEAKLYGFELIEPGAGWAWYGGDLLWSDDGGATWRRITPGDCARYRLGAVHFAGATDGWALLLPQAAAGTAAGAAGMESSPVLLARTGDAGGTWQFAALPVDVAEKLATAKAIYLAARDQQRGWIAANLATSSNFSRGALWYTQDGGVTWQERRLPLGEAFQPAGGETGYMAGGPRGGALWHTADGGITWQEQSLPRVPEAGERIEVYPPLVARDGSTMVLPLLVRGEAGQVVEWYAGTDSVTNAGADAHEAWELVQRYAVAEAFGLPMPATDPRAWLATQSGPVLQPVRPLAYFANTALGDGHRLVEVKMATALNGWALAHGPGKNAGLSPALLTTHDGGQSWQEITLPAVSPERRGPPAQPPPGLGAAAAVATVTRTSTVRGPGFDVCDLPAVSELATWYAASPYRTVNLYLGGVLRFCANQNLTAATLTELSAQGWTFIPTWVGPQAPCTGYRARYSSDPSDAFAQGRAEADAALAAAKAVGLSEADGSGTIVYYDMEAYDGSDESCVAAAQAFVAGWSSRLRERGSQAGVYGLACNPPLGRYASIGATPDAIWMAAWNRDAYDPSMTVWGISCIDDSLWARSQRIRQYTNSHDETWGGVTIEIDSNAVDSIAADLDVAPPTPTPTPTPQPSVLLEAPELEPSYDGGMCGAGWHMMVNARGYPAYLAANQDRNGTIPPPAQVSSAARQASWQPGIPSDGYYRVEAYIPDHDALQWTCPDAKLDGDTATAYYSVQVAAETTVKKASQAAVSDGWLLLGIYPFRASVAAKVTLATATDEAAYTRTVVASALRVTRIEHGPAGNEFLYLPQIIQR
jgi:photosystem II stability/assembly factor-like uncharacterized protein